MFPLRSKTLHQRRSLCNKHNSSSYDAFNLSWVPGTSLCFLWHYLINPHNTNSYCTFPVVTLLSMVSSGALWLHLALMSLLVSPGICSRDSETRVIMRYTVHTMERQKGGNAFQLCKSRKSLKRRWYSLKYVIVTGENLDVSLFQVTQ